MALAVSQHARLKPEIRLAQAVSQFEAALSSEEKNRFRELKGQTLNAPVPPDTTDVMRFTAHIDRRLANKAGHRCLGPRFTNFLQGVQQFAALGDVVVGGSQNIIACSVWSIVRMSILAMVNLSSHFESMSLVFMEIGRSTPRHQQLALIYPRSKDLRGYLNEYFIVVVRLCHDIFVFSQKSTVRQLTTSICGGNLKATQEELRMWAQEISDEVSVLVAKREEEEAAENAGFRSLSKTFFKTNTVNHRMVLRLRLLDECSMHDHETIWKQIRKSGNTILFTQAEYYKNWKSSSRPSTLLLSGKLGYGKSVVLANMVDDLNLDTDKANTSVVYFFIRQDHQATLTARTILGSIVRQLLGSICDISDVPGSWQSPLSVENMFVLLRKTFPSSRKAYLVLDGLDLCEQADRQEVVRAVHSLQEGVCLLACISFRQGSTVVLEDITDVFPYLAATPLPDNSADIASFVETELANCLKARRLTLGDAALILKIQDALLEGSSGMFLWVALQIKALCTMQTDAEITSALANLPRDLSDLYLYVLRRLSRSENSNMYQSRVLDLVAAARVPLQTAELREALSVTPGGTDWTSMRLVNDINSALASCGCLVEVDEEENTVRFVHPSVNDFLFQCYTDSKGTRRSSEICNKLMADIIVTYLNYGVFESQVSTSRVPQIQAGHAPAKIIKTVAASNKNTQSLALKLLSLRKRSDFDLGGVLAREVGHQKSRVVENFLFLSYARKWCLDHVCAVREESDMGIISTLLPRLIHHRSKPGLALETALQLAVTSHNTPLLKILLKTSLEEQELLLRALRAEAICRGYEDIIRLLEHWAPLTAPDCLPLMICHAIYDGFLTLVKQELTKDRQDQCNHVCISGRGVVACAVRRGSTVMLELVLEHVDPFHPGIHGASPVFEAISLGDRESLSILQLSQKVFLDAEEKERMKSYAQLVGFDKATHILNGFKESAWKPNPLHIVSLRPTTHDHVPDLR